MPLFAGNPGAVLFQECRLPATSLGEMRRLAHKRLPHYSLFAGRPSPALRHRVSQIQVLTLVHINLAARASLMDIGQQLAEVSQDAPDARWRAHFIRIIDPLSEVSLLLANVYQYQASQPEQQAALLTLIQRVVERWSSHADHVVVGGNFNASLRPRIGYAGLPHIQAADARLGTFLHDAGLAYEAPNMYT